MPKTIGLGGGIVRFSNRIRFLNGKSLCTTTTAPKNNSNPKNNRVARTSSVKDFDAYRDLDKLDFMTSAKILFNSPSNKKKFGIDFHLVQLFFVCMPSLAVYLVAQYARHEMRRMEMELELKKKAEEEQKEKELELSDKEEEEKAESDPDLLEVKERLGKLEEAVKEIVVESKKQSVSSLARHQENEIAKKPSVGSEASDTRSKSEGSTATGESQLDHPNSRK